MKLTAALTILLTFVIVSNIYSAPADTCQISITPYEFYLRYGGGMSEAQFCECFPCLCCPCKDTMFVKRDHGPCPPNKEV